MWLGGTNNGHVTLCQTSTGSLLTTGNKYALEQTVLDRFWSQHWSKDTNAQFQDEYDLGI